MPVNFRFFNSETLTNFLLPAQLLLHFKHDESVHTTWKDVPVDI